MKSNTQRKLGYAKENYVVDRVYKCRKLKRVSGCRDTLARMTIDELKEAWDRNPKAEYADEVLRRAMG